MRRVRIFAIVVLFFSAIGFGWETQVREANASDTCSAPFLSVSLPLNDLGTGEYIRMDGTPTGYIGGLYPGGSNVRPAEHEAAGLQIASEIEPLSSTGYSDPVNGKIVLVSVGMSNTSQEFDKFIELVQTDPYVNPSLIVVNGAVPGAAAHFWVDPNNDTWDRLYDAVVDAGATPDQVQVAWIKLAQIGTGEFPAKPQSLESDLKTIIQILKANYPNLRIAYLSSRTRSYAYWDGLSPEPDAYETGFSVKWVIQDQINGDPGLNYDPSNGSVVAPYLSWGPYLWIDGLNPRSDGLVWTQEDLMPDCTHPSISGMEKVASQLYDFFTADSTTNTWFLGGPGNPPPVPLPFRLYIPITVTSGH